MSRTSAVPSAATATVVTSVTADRCPRTCVPSSELSSIGHAASHGCMRMKRKDVEKLYNMIPVGTTVFIIK